MKSVKEVMRPARRYGTVNFRRGLVSGTATAILAWVIGNPQLVHAQEQQAEEDAESLLDVVVVTAQKKVSGQAVQDVPVAMSAFGAKQLEEANVVTLEDLTLSSPNVALESSGTARGVANFTIRGMGVNTSITSIEPTVGTFVDGVYLGVNAGVILDTFDLESVEVLRGPQGTLFGRNVTGGAVLLTTSRPAEQFQGKLQADLSSGFRGTGSQFSLAGSAGGSILPNRLRAKISAYYSKDDGWFHNQFYDDNQGENETYFFRPTFVFDVTDNVDQAIIYEYGQSVGDGSAFTNLNSGKDFLIESNNNGIFKLRWQAATSETNIRVPFGDGVITNIMGWRGFTQNAGSDIDTTSLTMYDLSGYIDQEQFSNELRYAGEFGPWQTTVGLYYFEQNYLSIDRRDLGAPVSAAPVSLTGGGVIDQSSWAIFTQNDLTIDPRLVFTIGLRYSHEEKDASITRTAPGFCDYSARMCDYTTPGSLVAGNSWNSLSPKLGVQWRPSEDVMVFGSYSQSTRSGGYNLRRISPLDPGYFDQEDVDAFEVGFKSDLFDNRMRLNSSVFYNQIEGVQRDVVLPGALLGGTGIVQTITNAADVDLSGIEVEMEYSPNRNWLLSANMGYTDSSYTKVLFDLNGDGVVNGADKVLELPRLSNLSYGVSIRHEREVLDGIARGRLEFGHRDEAPQNEANTMFLQEQNILNFDLSYELPNQRTELSIYGNNILNEVTGGAGAVLLPPNPATPDGVRFQVLDKGRVLGLKVRHGF